MRYRGIWGKLLSSARGCRAVSEWVENVALIDNKRLSSVVADRLQERIIEFEMPEGATLPTEPELMAEFGVSRTVVREAAALLVSRGLVEVRPRRGMTVRALDGQGVSASLIAQLRMNKVSLQQLLEVRLALECSIARLAAEARTDADLVLLDQNLQQMADPTLSRDNTVAIDMSFHVLLAKATHNPFFVIVTRPINELLRSLYIDKVGYMSLTELTTREHRKIFEAIAHRDAEAADAATRDHLRRVGSSIAVLAADRSKAEAKPGT